MSTPAAAPAPAPVAPLAAADTADAPIRLSGVRVAFGDRVVLDHLDLVVPRGKNVVIMGLSGTGKSVTLKAVAGLQKVNAGEIVVAGVHVENARRAALTSVRSKLGFLFQSGALIRWMTALENVALPLVENGVPRAEADARARKRLDEVGLGDSANKRPDEMSGGMAKRVGFCRATIANPAILLYDEPTTGLDPITKRTIDDLIVHGRDKFGATGVIVSHDLRGAMRTGDLIALLYEGRIAVVLPPREFIKCDHPIVREFVRDDGGAAGGK
ncbi:MAG: ATP-binding cassette domain-containing protein [Planctomycetes bacterium]|nr:ATP-binding cassette domain-containing protein [Planctomycetota bacterium]